MTSFDDLLAPYDPDIRLLAREVRWLVLSVAPDAHQEVHESWGRYLLFKQGSASGNTVCHVSAHKKHVSLGIAQGNLLPDPAGLLQGGGKHSRHLKFKSSDDLKRPEVRALIEAAWAMQPDAGVLEAGLKKVREICLALPETREEVSHGHPTFFGPQKSFAVFGLYSPSVAFKASFETQTALEGDPRFFPTPYLASAGWLSVKIDADTDWTLVRRLLEESYQQVHKKRPRVGR